MTEHSASSLTKRVNRCPCCLTALCVAQLVGRGLLQALPAGHPVQRAYAADLASRQQLAAVSGDALLAAGAVRHRLRSAASSSSSDEPIEDRKTRRPSVYDTHRISFQASQGAIASSRRLQHLPHKTASQQQQQLQQRLQGLPPLDKLQQQRNTASKELATGPAIVRRRPRQAASGAGVRQYTCGSWQFELDEAQGETKKHASQHFPLWFVRGQVVSEKLPACSVRLVSCRHIALLV